MTSRPCVFALFLAVAASADVSAQTAAPPERQVAVGLGPAYGLVMVGEHGIAQTGPTAHLLVGLGWKNRWSVDVDVQPFKAPDALRPQAVRSLYLVPSYRIPLGRSVFLRLGAGAAVHFWSNSAHRNENDIASQPDARHARRQIRPALGLTLGAQFRKRGATFAIAPEAFLHVSAGDALIDNVSLTGVRLVASWFRGRDSAGR